jgi:hypothetical protein
MFRNAALRENGFIIVDFPLQENVLDFVKSSCWDQLDKYFLDISVEGGQLRNVLLNFVDFKTLEHIISIRRAPDDEDGIWHDDGSRELGFSLSLNLNCQNIDGGELRFKKKDSQTTHVFKPQPYGKMILFLSGIYGYEHMVGAVTQGERIVIAGWCS